MNYSISKNAAIDAVNSLIDRFERILSDIRESKVDDSVCGMCEYDGAFVGQSGDWCNECPGFEKDDCFKLSDECRKRWLESVKLPPAQSAQRWIPCSERLPEESGRYLISVLDGVGRRTTVAPYQPRYKAWTMTGRMAYWKVIAWMPLPEPAKIGSD